MAPKGLPSVEAKFTADNSGYITAIEEMIEKNRDLIVSIREVNTTIKSISDSVRDLDGKTVTIYVKYETIGKMPDPGDITRTIRYVTEGGDIGKALPDQAAVDRISAVTEGLQGLGDNNRPLIASLDDLKGQLAGLNEEMRDEATALNNLRDKYKNLGAAARDVTLEQDAVGSFLNRYTSAAADASITTDVLRKSSEAFRSSLVDMEARINSARGALAELNAQATVGNALGNVVSGAPNAEVSAGFLRNVMSPRGSDTGAAFALAAMMGGGGGGPGALGGMLAGIGDEGGGGGGGGFGLGGSLIAFRNTAAFVRRWYPVAHWAMMLTNEILATAGPAVIAGGAAAAVGLEGGQTAFMRGSAINAVDQSLGGALGMTSGQFLGLKGRTLQSVQTQADPGVWELGGAAINSLSGKMQGFQQIGLNTIAMLDQFGARVTLAFKGTAGNDISSLVQQGTNDLKQFGDVAANIATTFVHVAPNLPGVGGDLLTTLAGATRGLSNLTGILPGAAIGGALSFEAGARWGPPLVGGLASLLGKVGALGGSIADSGLALGAGEGGLIEGGLFGVGATNFLSKIMSGGGGAISKFFGTAARAATSEDILAGAMGVSGVPVAEAGDIVAGTGLAGGLGALGATGIGAIAAGTYLAVKAVTAKTPAQDLVGQTLSAVGQDDFSKAIKNVIPAMNTLAQAVTAVPAPVQQSTAGITLPAYRGRWGESGAYAAGQTQQTLTSGIQQLAGTFNNLLDAGASIAQQFGTTIPQAFNLADQAQLQTGDAFTKQGKLTAVATQQIKNMQTGYAAMHSTSGVFGQNVGAVNTALGLQATQLSTVNSAWDQFVSNAVAGVAGTAGLNASFAAVAPSLKSTAEGLNNFGAAGAAAWNTFASSSTTTPGLLQQTESMADFIRTAQTSGVIGGAQGAAMTAHLAQQLLPYGKDSSAALAAIGIIGQQADLNTVVDPAKSQAQNYKAISDAINKAADSTKEYNKGQAQAAIGMSNISQQAAQFSDTLNSSVVNALASGSINLAKVSKDSGNLTKTLQSPDIANAAAPIAQVFSDIKQGGGTAADAIAIVSQRAAALGIHSGEIQQALSLAQGLMMPSGTPGGRTTLSISQARTIPSIPGVAAAAQAAAALQAGAAFGGKDQAITYKANVEKPNIPHVGDQIINYNGHVHMPNIPKVPDQSFNIIGHVIIEGGAGGAGMGMASIVGAGGRQLLGQHGFRVPGYGGGDIHPALLEGGEAVVPKHLVPSIAPFLGAHGVPGFQDGGLISPTVPFFPQMGAAIRDSFQSLSAQLFADMQQIMQSVSRSTSSAGSPLFGLQPSGGGSPSPKGTASSPVVVHVGSVSPSIVPLGTSAFLGGAAPMPAAANKVIDAFEKTFASMPGPWSQVASQILNGLLLGVKNASKETASMAQALVNKVTTEINFGRSVTNTAVAGLNFPGMQVATPTTTSMGTPYQYYTDQANIAAGGQPGSVQEQMGSYLQAMQSFQGDMGKLAKGGLEKRLLSQLYSAGPIQGDAEAQSILSGPGGIKAANQLYNQINSLATKLGVSAIGNVYGAPLQGKDVKVGVNANAAPVHALQAAIDSLHGKTVNISVNVTTTSGSSSGSLSKTQIKQVGQQIQAHMLQQAQRNRRTGLTLPGYGS